MCGIVGVVSEQKFTTKNLLSMLKKLEYRGYDSAGISVEINGKLYIEKEVGEISKLESKIKDVEFNVGISHTRWSTTGRVTQANAHPHTDCSGNLSIVHNGIFENYEQIKEKLIKEGHTFKSDTDTEVIAHYFEKSQDIMSGISKFFAEAQGEFAILLMKKGENKIYAFKRGSPLCMGIAENATILSSDAYSFAKQTSKVIFFNENEIAVAGPDSYQFYDKNLNKIKKEIKILEWHEEESIKEYDHYFLKEIMDQPAASRRLIKSLENEQKEKVDILKQLIKSSKRIVFVACGSSYFASLLGVYFLNKAGVEAHAVIASEFRNFYLRDDKTLLIAVTQSGETMDLIKALSGTKAGGVKIASIVNRPYSTIERMGNVSIQIHAGNEISVAATKSYVNQVIFMMHLAKEFGLDIDINSIPLAIEEALKKEIEIELIAKKIANKNDVYIIGRGLSYPVSREIALKLKEIANVHAEGMMGGELKHGTLALIEEGTPVITLFDGNHDILTNAKEVETRGGEIIEISPEKHFPTCINVNGSKDAYPISAVVVGQLLTYHIAKLRGLPIDKPRNIAKTVTVL